MKKVSLSKIWNYTKKKVSEILVVCMLITSISPATRVYANNNEIYRLIDELEVDEASVDEGMFYMPYASFEANEGDKENKLI